MRYLIPFFLILTSCTDVKPLAVSQQSVSLIENEGQTSAKSHINIAMEEKEILNGRYSQTPSQIDRFESRFNPGGSN